jgi:hypothetical protein
MNEKITININGTEKEVYFVTIVTLDKYNSSYLVYMEHKVRDFINMLCFGKIIPGNDKTYLEAVSEEEEKDIKAYLAKEFEDNE